MELVGRILAVLSCLCNTVCFISSFSVFLIHYSGIFLFVLCVLSVFLKLRRPKYDVVISMLGKESLFHPVAFLGATFDHPENTKVSIEKCVEQNCRKILLSLDITANGELVVLDKTTLEAANIFKPINKITLEELKSFNVAEYHPLGKNFEKQYVLTLKDLFEVVKDIDVTIFLHATNKSRNFIEKLRETILNNPSFDKKFIFCSSSVFVIYKLRKAFPKLVCAIWTEQLFLTLRRKKFFKFINVLLAIYDVVFRNIITPILGVNVIFVHKDEFNAHISELWANVGIIPIVYKVNSPSEKRYFQNVIKTRYLTDSIRSEPQIIFRSKNFD